MSRVIEHKIRLVDRPPPPSVANSNKEEKSNVTQSTIPSKPTRNFQKFGDEQTSSVECYEKALSYSPNELKRQQFSGQTLSESRVFGRDEDGQVLSIKVDSSDSSLDHVDPVSPVRPIDSSYDNPNPFNHPIHAEHVDFEQRNRNASEHLLRLSPHLDTKPLKIPRVNIDDNGKTMMMYDKSNEFVKTSRKDDPDFRSQSQPSRLHLAEDRNFPSLNRWDSGLGSHIGSAASNIQTFGTLSTIGPMKKVTRKSRFVSIHDGSPVSPFVETVHYEPIFGPLTRQQSWPDKNFCDETTPETLGVNCSETRRTHFVGASPVSLSPEQSQGYASDYDHRKPHRHCFPHHQQQWSERNYKHLDQSYDGPIVNVIQNPLYVDH